MLTRAWCAAALVLLSSGGFAAADDAAILRGLFGVEPGILIGPRAQPRGNWVLEGPVRGGRPIERRSSATRARTPAVQTAQSEERILLRKEIQRRLKLLGYFTGKPDGVFGPRSRAAISKFQRRIGEPSDGKLTEGQIAALYSLTGDAVADDGGDFDEFPTLAGGDGGDAGDGGQGFPALAARAADPGSSGAFPPLAENDGGPKGSSGMPALARPVSGEAGKGMPALAPAGAGRQDGSAFPQLAAPPANDDRSTPPPLAPARQPKADEELPALAPSSAAAAFPNLAPAKDGENLASLDLTPPAAPAPAYPDLATAPPPRDRREELRDRGDFAAELAKASIASPDAAPKMLDIALGSLLADVDAKLKSSGFAPCSVSDETARCAKSTPSLDDSIEARASATTGIWSLRRRIDFKQSVKRDYILSRLSASMPTLMKDADVFLASRATCMKDVVRAADVDGRLDAATASLARKERESTIEAVDFALRCPLFFDVSVTPAAGDISGIDIWFFDGTPLVRSEAAQAEEERVREEEKLKVVDGDLKL